MPTATISQEVMDVLFNLDIDGQNVRIVEQLDRKLYLGVNDVLQRLGGAWKRGAKAHVFPEGRDPSDLIADVMGTGTMPAKNPLSYFFTPEPVGHQLIDLAESINPKALEGRILEPQAGEGHLAQVINQRAPHRVGLGLVELDEYRVNKLAALTFRCGIWQGDFLNFSPRYCGLTYSLERITPKKFNTVICNPPFSIEGNPTVYIDHIKHSMGLLEEYGTVVAIAPAGFVFRQDEKTASFRNFVECNGEWHELPHDAFAESGTMVKTVMLGFKVPTFSFN